MPNYFSGEQAQVFFRGQLVDDIVTLDYAGQQQKMPLFGYKSHLWDRVVRGKFLIQGSFTIAYTEPFKLLRILSLGSLSSNVSERGIDLDDPFIKLSSSDKAISNRSFEENLFEINRSNPSYFTDVISPTLKNSTWGPFKSSPHQRRVDQHDYRDRGFLGDDDSDTFSIVIQYAGSDAMDILDNVRILNVSKILQPNGDPILEKYDFLAKDMDQTVAENPSSASLPVAGGVLAVECPLASPAPALTEPPRPQGMNPEEARIHHNSEDVLENVDINSQAWQNAAGQLEKEIWEEGGNVICPTSPVSQDSIVYFGQVQLVVTAPLARSTSYAVADALIDNSQIRDAVASAPSSRVYLPNGLQATGKFLPPDMAVQVSAGFQNYLRYKDDFNGDAAWSNTHIDVVMTASTEGVGHLVLAEYTFRTRSRDEGSYIVYPDGRFEKV